MFPHAYPVSDKELDVLKDIIRQKGDCNLSRKYSFECCCPKDLYIYCSNLLEDDINIYHLRVYNKVIEIFIDLFGEAALFEELL